MSPDFFLIGQLPSLFYWRGDTLQGGTVLSRTVLADRRVLISTILCQLEFITDTIVRVAGMTASIDVFTGYRFEVEF